MDELLAWAYSAWFLMVFSSETPYPLGFFRVQNCWQVFVGAFCWGLRDFYAVLHVEGHWFIEVESVREVWFGILLSWLSLRRLWSVEGGLGILVLV